jgi:hypothetical protein
VSPATAEFIVVWRDGDSPALQTYAHDTNKSARVFKNGAPELVGTAIVDNDAELEHLLATPGPFGKVRVTRQSAKRVLGWTV